MGDGQYSKRLAGKTAVVTGGGRGIGRAIVERFMGEGAAVLSCGRSERPDNFPREAHWIRADVSDTGDVRALGSAVERIFGRLSILVNNAGIQIEKTVLETTDEDWETLMGVNARGVFACSREMIPLMDEGGSIINIGSTSGSTADPGLALYNASKAFVHGLTRSIAVDHGPKIRCNAISPGWIMTEMADAAFAVADDPEKAKRDALARHPAGRFGDPSDIAALASWLASDDALFATGQCYTLDGGLTAASPLNPCLF
ncbi:MAG: SDR family oxidoreductase [Gammaproteobacteria bacterium]|nr:SDR family oxidoreductase [Gammaproteobacteria bacterium]